MMSAWKYRIINENGSIEKGKCFTDRTASEICKIFEQDGKEVVYLEKVKVITLFNFVKSIGENIINYA